MSAALCCLLLVLASYVAAAQQTGSVKFEVASVKPAPPDEDVPTVIRGGPGTAEPELIIYQRVFLLRVIHAAYGLDFDQISGPPWLEKELYSIVAKGPPGANAEQLKLMWQDLLADRFHFRAHFVKKDFPVYELGIAKGGPKFREEPGFPVPRSGEKFALRPAPRDIRLTFRDCPMTEFAERLGWPLSTTGSNWLVVGRVIDKTGLNGLYSFTLEFAGSWGPGGAFPPPLPEGQIDAAPLLIDALRQQLGLTLIEKKAPLDVLVVDYVDKVPTEN
jgi:uncharacterized protein (TIGR03435 family)